MLHGGAGCAGFVSGESACVSDVLAPCGSVGAPQPGGVLGLAGGGVGSAGDLAAHGAGGSAGDRGQGGSGQVQGDLGWCVGGQVSGHRALGVAHEGGRPAGGAEHGGHAHTDLEGQTERAPGQQDHGLMSIGAG